MAKYIRLTQGKRAVVSDRDYRAVMAKAPWYYDGSYAVRMTPRPNRRKLYMHRLIAWLRGDSRKMEVDHRNHKGLDNQRRNLRSATRSQQSQNSRKQQRSLPKGVRWHTRDEVFTAQISGKHIGTYPTAVAAHRAYCREAGRLFGDFACTR
jgi:hypothetical protein